MKKPFLELRGITKDFPGVRALDSVDFDVKSGEVHVLLGENGAGKSTLMKILSGVYAPSSGRIFMDGREVRISTPRIAQDMGISTIFQETSLVPYLTAAENIFLGKELRNRYGLDVSEMNNQSATVLARLGVSLEPSSIIKSLGVAEQQMVEIAKALLAESRLVIMDEPTSALGGPETQRLFDIILTMKSRGVAVIYITHRLEELFTIGDVVTVMRDGQVVDTVSVRDVDQSSLIHMMVGRTIDDVFPRDFVQPGQPVLRVSKLCNRKLKDVDLIVREGEIVGLAGLVGAGRTELAEAIFGLEPIDSGSVEVNDIKLGATSPSDSINVGMGLLPEDRRKHGLCLSMPVKANITKSSLHRLFPSGFISRSKEDEIADSLVRDLHIRPPLISRAVRLLSGGNQQKTVLAQWLCTGSKMLIFDEPTRGVDVGAKVEVHQFMNELVKNGHGILMISSELPEILGMSDRIYIMHEGRIVKEFARGEASQEEIMLYATGGGES